MTAGLVMDAPPERGLRPGFTRPTLIPPLPAEPIGFPDLPALARHVQRERGRRGLELRAAVASYNASDTFPMFNVYWLGDTGDREWAYAAAIQTDRRETLEAALAAANPRTPKALAGARR